MSYQKGKCEICGTDNIYVDKNSNFLRDVNKKDACGVCRMSGIEQAVVMRYPESEVMRAMAWCTNYIVRNIKYIQRIPKKNTVKKAKRKGVK